MERLHADRLEEHYPMLAVHFTRGGDLEKGYHYRTRVGERATLSFSNREATEHFSQAWRLLDDMEQNQESQRRRLDTAVRLAQVMETLGEFDRTLAFLHDALGASEGDLVGDGDMASDGERLILWLVKGLDMGCLMAIPMQARLIPGPRHMLMAKYPWEQCQEWTLMPPR